ncbi:hypothetical protein AB0K04_03175 [Micromonospora coxensis]|uniref:hypothetical protein n=1 Tax=Micromonospora coxensis TaxID=356852 RepID=UPI0034364E4A
MGQSWKYVFAWLASTVAAVAVSWLGVRVAVAPAVTAEAPVAIDVNRRYTEVRFGTAGATPAPATPLPQPSRTSARPTPSPSASPSVRPKPSRPAATRSTSPSPSAPDRRPRYPIDAEGGSLTVAYSSTRVDVISVDPRPGYVVSTARRSDTFLVVRFTGPGHSSIVTAAWQDGPTARIVEEYGG